MDWDRYLFTRFLIAVPELNLDREFIQKAGPGSVGPDETDAYLLAIGIARNLAENAKKMRGKDLIQRILIIAPELLSTKSVDWLRANNLISVQEGHALRVGLRATNKLLPGILGVEKIGERLASVVGGFVTRDAIDMWRRIDQAKIDALANSWRDENQSRLTSEQATKIRALEKQSIETAAKLRAGMEIARLGADTIREAAVARDVWSAVAIVASNLLSDDLLLAAIKAGAIDSKHYNLIRAIEIFGLDAWSKGVAAFKQESWAARALMISEGILTSQAVDVLYRAGWINKDLAMLLRPATTIIRSITRGQLANYQPSRKYRVIPGESPIKTFARATGATDRAILGLLQEAANDARKVAERAAASAAKSGLTRAAQQRLIVKALNDQTRALWENVGYMTIFGEKDAARAALESIDYLNGKVFGKTARSKAIQIMLQRQAESGVDSYISRQENLLQLSSRIYNNTSLMTGRVQREVQKALLRGVSARELADRVSGLIKPGVPGGVSYSAMRLARTEINNAFHFTQIRYTREMPWVRGYRWNLSGSHPTPDECNTYADKNHEGMGKGVFSKRSVPGKPHPNCLCFLTTVSDDSKTFEQGLRNGRYDRFMDQSSQTLFDDPASRDIRRSGAGLAIAKQLGSMLGNYVANNPEGLVRLGSKMASGSAFKMRRPTNGGPVQFC